MPRDPSPRDAPGLVLAAASATGLGIAIAVSRLAYEGGSNGLTVATARSWLFVPALYVFCRLSGRSVRLPRRDWHHVLGLGVLMSVAFYGNVGAVEFIPVGLAAILFYTFPPMIGLIQAFVVGEAPGAVKSVALAVAFAGIVLMLGVSSGKPDPRGVVLALGAALAIACNTVWVERRMTHVDGVVLTFHMGVVAAVMLSTVAVLTRGMAPPVSASGWTGLCLVAVLQTVSLPLFYMALPRIGPLRAAMVANVQPLVSIACAYLLFAELMSPMQFSGGALVLAAIWLMQRQSRRQPAAPGR